MRRLRSLMIVSAIAAAPTTALCQEDGRTVEELDARIRALEAERQARPANADRADRADREFFQFSDRPEWERPDLWMWPGFRAEETKDMLIGRSSNIDLYMGLHSAGRLQWLEQDDVFIAGKEGPDLEPSFQTAWGDLSFMAEVGDGDLIVFADLYLSSRPHASTTYGNEGYMLFRRIPDKLPGNDFLNDTIFRFINVKAGHFEIDFGDAHYRRSDNAWVSRNLLIGNYLVDPDVEEIGVEVFTKPGPVNALFGVSSGTTTENTNTGRGLAAIHGKIWVEPTDDLRISASGYYVDHSDNPTSGTGATKGSLFSGRRSGGPYASVWGGGNSPGDLTMGGDELVTALQGDITWSPGPWEFYGHMGWMEDADPNGSAAGKPSERWIYGAAEAAYFFTPRTHVAGRYSFAQADDVKGHDSDGQIHRVQVGVGHWLTRNTLVKAEYVHQMANGFEVEDGVVGGVAIAEDPSFNGILMEVSFKF